MNSDFGGSATGPDARPAGGNVSAAIRDRPRNQADGPVPPRPAGLGGFGSLVPRRRIRVNLSRRSGDALVPDPWDRRVCSRGTRASPLRRRGWRRQWCGGKLFTLHAYWRRECHRTIVGPFPPHPIPLPRGEGKASSALGPSEQPSTPCRRRDPKMNRVTEQQGCTNRAKAAERSPSPRGEAMGSRLNS